MTHSQLSWNHNCIPRFNHVLIGGGTLAKRSFDICQTAGFGPGFSGRGGRTVCPENINTLLMRKFGESARKRKKVIELQILSMKNCTR